MSHLDGIIKTLLSGNSNGLDALCQEPRTKTIFLIVPCIYNSGWGCTEFPKYHIPLFFYFKIKVTLRHWLPCADENLCFEVPALNHK